MRPLIAFVIPIINNASLEAARRLIGELNALTTIIGLRRMPNRKYTGGELLNANEAAINHPAQLLAFDPRNDAVPALCIAITD